MRRLGRRSSDPLSASERAKQRQANAEKRQKQRKRKERFRRYDSAITFVNQLSRRSRRDISLPKIDGGTLPRNPLPAIWSGLRGFGTNVVELLRQGGTGWHPSKAVSIILLLGATGLIAWLHQSDDFFVYPEDVTFQNLTYIDSGELYATSQLEGWSTFWLDRDSVRENLRRHPYVADARISIGLPARVSIDVSEEEPVALWVTDAGTLWLLQDGTALAARHGDTEGLLQILDGQAESREVSYEPKVSMDREVLDNARKIATYFPTIDTITFNRGFGLNFAVPESGLWVYWGDGGHFETKLKNLLTIQNELSQGRISGQLADLRVPEKPIIR